MKGRIIVTLMILHVTIRFTEELIWKTQMRKSTCCQGNKQHLIWNFTTTDNERVKELHWFFKGNTLVCFQSDTTGFLVTSQYTGRVERNGKAGILLRNVSFNDEGEYTLHVKLDEEKERNIQGISLTVVEAPPNQCKPIINKTNHKDIISCSTSCEKSPLSLEWIINGTQDPVGTGPYFLVNSSWTSQQSFCCLRDFKCHDEDQFKFCTPNHISFTEDTHSVIQSFKDTDHMVFLFMLILNIVMAAVFIIVFARIKLRRRCGSCHKWHDTETLHTMDHTELQPLGHKWHDTKTLPMMDYNELEILAPKNSNTVGQCNMDLPQVNTVPVTTVAVEPKNSNTVVQCNEDLQQVYTVTATTDATESQNLKKQCNEELEDVNAAAAITVAVEPKNSNKVVQCNEDLQQVYTVAATTDRPLQDSNQQAQIVNYISIDTDFLKSIIHSNTALVTELQASRKETRKLKRHITDLRRKQNRHKYSIEMTKMKFSDFKDYDTDTSETSDFEDASSSVTASTH